MITEEDAILEWLEKKKDETELDGRLYSAEWYMLIHLIEQRLGEINEDMS